MSELQSNTLASVWKPREDYKTLAAMHRPILTRHKNGLTGPMLVIYSEHGTVAGGHFYPVPGVPIFYGDHQFGMMTNDSFDEWTEIPA